MFNSYSHWFIKEFEMSQHWTCTKQSWLKAFKLNHSLPLSVRCISTVSLPTNVLVVCYCMQGSKRQGCQNVKQFDIKKKANFQFTSKKMINTKGNCRKWCPIKSKHQHDQNTNPDIQCTTLVWLMSSCIAYMLYPSYCLQAKLQWSVLSIIQTLRNI